jgi:hypothetical protein
MVMRPSPALDFSDTPAIFAINTRYYPFDGQGRCTKESENSKLLREMGLCAIESVMVWPSNNATATIYNGNGEVIIESRQQSTLNSPIEFVTHGPVLCDGLPSMATSSLDALIQVTFRGIR